MLRITKDVEGTSTRLKLEGALRKPWVAEVTREVQSLNGARAQLQLDLAEVTFVDADGVALLRQLLDHGATITASSGFVALVLGLEKP